MPVLVNSFVSFGSTAPASTYAGYNTIGGSTAAMTRYKAYTKSVTFAVDSLVTSIGAYVIATSNNNSALQVAVFEDNSGTPRYVLGYSGSSDYNSALLDGSDLLMEPSVGNAVARWLHRDLGLWCPAGTYWIAVMDTSVSPSTIAFDATGADRIYTSGGKWFADWGFYSPTTTGNQYSIRAEVMT